MKPPVLPEEHPDRLLDLEKQLELPMRAAMEAARLAGYDVYEIDYAVRQLTANFVTMHRGETKVWSQAADEISTVS